MNYLMPCCSCSAAAQIKAELTKEATLPLPVNKAVEAQTLVAAYLLFAISVLLTRFIICAIVKLEVCFFLPFLC